MYMASMEVHTGSMSSGASSNFSGGRGGPSSQSTYTMKPRFSYGSAAGRAGQCHNDGMGNARIQELEKKLLLAQAEIEKVKMEAKDNCKKLEEENKRLKALLQGEGSSGTAAEPYMEAFAKLESKVSKAKGSCVAKVEIPSVPSTVPAEETNLDELRAKIECQKNKIRMLKSRISEMKGQSELQNALNHRFVNTFKKCQATFAKSCEEMQEMLSTLTQDDTSSCKLDDDDDESDSDLESVGNASTSVSAHGDSGGKDHLGNIQIMNMLSGITDEDLAELDKLDLD